MKHPRVVFYPAIHGDGIGTYIEGIRGILKVDILDGPGSILSLKTFFCPVPTGYDIVHVPNFLVPFLKRKSKVVCTIQDIIPILKCGNLSLLKRAYMFLRIWWSLYYSDHIIFTSENTRNDVLRIFRKVGPYSIIPLSMDSPLIFNNAPESLLTFSYCFSVGRRRNHKNTEGIIRSFAKAAPLTSLHLVFGGKEDIEDSRWRSLADELGIKDRVHFSGFLSSIELATYYANASSLLFPSLYEGFGLPILEAMSYGCPVITSKTSSMPEVAGGAAILVDPLNYDEIAESIVLIEKDSVLRAKLISLGFENCKKYSWEKVAEATSFVYRNIS
ncbi:glycosyltransferase family 1 protein [Limnohabitans sp. JirII-31]|uniref:glycosyltransferase family 4 protein n=1 Tax=Limnohabitans sp. JirII-31 TaxID=1977908 RepID=UPI001E5391C5|nr:glycosyltransferase family 1 protein [Limnohabitans sp. JirII-31]